MDALRDPTAGRWTTRRNAASQDTIFALSTPLGKSAVAVIRLSGPRTGAVLDALAAPLPSAREAAFRTIRDPVNREPIDHGLVLWFPGPASFTGQDCGEFQIHGSVAAVGALSAVLAAFPGLREAEPGEFTRRAFANDKLDLDRTEALADLIDAQTERQRRLAMQALSGGLAKLGMAWRVGILDILAEIDARLDFSDEGDVDSFATQQLAGRLDALRAELGIALAAAERARSLREGFVVAICGPPNSGKSTLLNALAGREHAIVSPHAGTTRDAIEVSLDLGGALVSLVDTAGLRDTADPVEALGIDRAQAAARRADFVIWLEAPDEPCAPPSDLPVDLRLWSKGDLHQATDARLQISAASGSGLDRLTALLTTHAGALPDGDAALLRSRHLDIVRALREDVSMAAADVRADRLEVAAAYLRGALEHIERLGSKSADEDILDRIFGRFCIGK